MTHFGWLEIIQELRFQTRGYEWRFCVLIVLLTVTPIAQLAEPIIFGQAVDRLIAIAQGTGTFRDIITLLSLWFFIEIVAILFHAMAEAWGYYTSERVWLNFWERLIRKVFYFDLFRLQREPIGKLARRLERSSLLTWETFTFSLKEIIPSVVTIVSFIFIGLWLDWRMLLVSLVTLLPILLFTVVGQRWVEEQQRLQDKMWEKFSGDFMQKLTNIELIQQYGAHEYAISQHLKMQSVLSVSQLQLNHVWIFIGAGSAMASFLSRFITLFAGFWFVGTGSITVGTVVTFVTMLGFLLEPFNQLLLHVARRLAELKSTYAKVIPFLRESNLIQEKDRAKKIQKILGEYTFERVSYFYPNKVQLAIKDLSFVIHAGESVALVGRSGSGKSTLVKLLTRFVDPTSGVIRLDGVALPDVRLKDLRSAVAIVSQETQVLNASVIENMRLVKPQATKSEIVRALEKAYIWHVIKELPEGLDTLLGERGVRLSGGERQRLSLARAFLADRPILILDESTSALDSETELRVQRAVESIIDGRTSVIIAHRLSTIRSVDRIFVFDGGKIVEIGTHDELLALNGFYARLWRLQSTDSLR